MNTPTAAPLTSTPVQIGEATRRYLPYGRPSAVVQVDWAAAPARYKAYPAARRVVLPWPPDRRSARPGDQPGDRHLERLSALLYGLSGLTRLSWSHPVDPMTGRGLGNPPGQVVLRPAPSGGALYPVEVYLATGTTTDPPTGLYHYDPAHHTMDLLRDGDHRAALTGLLPAPPETTPDLILALAPLWWRNAFKYHEFGYRIMCQETGVLTAQALAVAEPLGLAATVHLRYADEPVNRLLGLETFRESVTALLTFHQPAGHTEDHGRDRTAPSYTDLLTRPTATATAPPPTITHLLPVATALHAASLAPSPCPPPQTAQGTDHGSAHASSLPDATAPPIPLPATNVQLAAGIPHRASAPAGFHRRPLGREALATILTAASQHHPEELRGTIHLYSLLSHVKGLAPGGYRYDPHDQVLLPIAGAEAIEAVVSAMLTPMTWLALREAAAALIPVGNPEAEIAHHADRGYRLLQIATGLTTHRAALAAAALGLSARLYSDGTTSTTDTALGLSSTSWSSQTMLLIGLPLSMAGTSVERLCCLSREDLRRRRRVDSGGECRVPVADEEAERADLVAEVPQQVAGGRRGPGCGRVRGHPE